MEEKYAHLSAAEVMTFYSNNFTDPFIFPKDYTYCQSILHYSGLVKITAQFRSGENWAYSETQIIKIITPIFWNGDLFQSREISM